MVRSDWFTRWTRFTGLISEVGKNQERDIIIYNLMLLTKFFLIPVNSPPYPPRPSPPLYTCRILPSFFIFSSNFLRFFTLGFLTSFLRLGARPLFFAIAYVMALFPSGPTSS